MTDIAAHLGVSRQLVSIVLRDEPGASVETRKRVRKAASELGYSPHAGARALRRATSRHLGVVFTPAHATEPDIVEALYAAADAAGYHVILSAQTEARSTAHAVEELLGYRCAAVIVLGSRLADTQLTTLAARARVPLVSVGSGTRNRGYDVVHSAGDDGMEAAVRHLHDLGHREIAFVDPASMPPAALRLAGYQRAAEAFGLASDVLTMTGDYTEESGAAAARELLGRNSLPTAIVAGNDQAAFGLLQVLIRAGVSVPGDVSVVGYDGIRLVGLSCVELTTLRQDPGEMGRAAVEAALRRIRHPSALPSEIVIAPVLVVRSSTAPPRRT